MTVPGTQGNPLYVKDDTTSGPLLVDSTTLATSAKQDTGNTSLTSIDAKNPALVAGRVPVDGSGVTQPVDTELPAAVLLANGAAIPTTPTVGSLPLLYNGTTLDLAKGAVDGNARTATGLPQSALMAHASAANFNPLKVASAIGDAHDGSNYLPILAYRFNGATGDRARAAKTFKTLANGAVVAGTPVAGWTPTAGKKFRALRGDLSLSVAGQIILKDGATEILRSPQLAAGGVWSFVLGEIGILSSLANNVLNIDVSVNGSVGGWLGGTEE